MFGARKNGREDIAYPHPLLEEVLKETYGIFVYQEQVMQAAQVLAGYSLGEADLLRRAMGKKIKAEMDAQRERFVTGCAQHDIKPAKANELFDLIDKFAGYGFNKSHAAAYALVAYQTAWLKAHYPIEFYAASMCFDSHQTDKLAIFIDDLRRGGHLCLPPSINASEAEFTVEPLDPAAQPELVAGLPFSSSPAQEGQADRPKPSGEGNRSHAVRYALGALKGVGERAMEQLVAEREANGRFKSLEDLAARIDPRALNRRQVESLAGAGAFDEIAERPTAFASAETILAVASSAASERTSGQGGLFGEGPANVVPIRPQQAGEWSLAERMNQEKEAFGFYFSAHPVDRFRHLADAQGARTFAALAEGVATAEGSRVGATMAALVEEARWRTSQKGRRFLMARLSDSSGQFDATVFDDAAAEALEKAAKAGECALLNVELDRRPGEETPRVTIRSLTSFEALTRRTRLQLEVAADDPAAIAGLAALLSATRGGSSLVRLRVHHGKGEADLILGRDFVLDAELVARVERLPGIAAARLTAEEKPRLALVG
jgi:DNA polymerase-3 subunit alpha